MRRDVAPCFDLVPVPLQLLDFLLEIPLKLLLLSRVVGVVNLKQSALIRMTEDGHFSTAVVHMRQMKTVFGRLFGITGP